MLNGLYNDGNKIPVRKIPGIWQKYGPSYEALSNQQKNEKNAINYEHINLESCQKTMNQGAAGNLSNQPLKGTGTFQYQVEWSLGNSDEQHSFSTENKYRYIHHNNYNQKGDAFVPTSRMPKETYANDYRTTKVLDHSASQFEGWSPPGKIIPKDSGVVYPKEPAHKFETTYKTLLKGQQQDKDLVGCGKENCCNPGYNIITGGAPLENNPFEYWQPQDYRRRR